MAANPYSIDVHRLKDGEHAFDFHVGAAFFAQYPEQLVDDADIAVTVRLSKNTRLIDLRMGIAGALTLACDRCLQPFGYAIDTDARIVYSYDTSLKETEEMDDVSYLPREQQHLDLTQDIYDYIALQIPIRRLPEGCPGDICPPHIRQYLSDEEQTQPAENQEEESIDELDPRWAALKKLRESGN